MEKKKYIISVVRKSLGYIDKRLMDHGERVAFIADGIIKACPQLKVERKKMLVLCLLHDVGAYKTEEIDDMVKFDSDNVTNHAVYGYAFLRNSTAMGEGAEAILYHHTDYVELEKIDTAQKLYAELIGLADRIDILLLTFGKPGLERLNKYSEGKLSPDLIELFFTAEQELSICDKVLDGSYEQYILDALGEVELSEDEVMGYLRMLVYSIDFRSPFTVTHTANTVAISKQLASLFNMDEEERYLIEAGAFLHDIGKLAIPYSILENPGRLSAEQMAIMRTHVEVSEDILRGTLPDEVVDIAVRHHEKLNGSGYPKGLTAPELTLAQRIVAVADITSALINRRSYKEPFKKETALSILRQMKDRGELCPTVCDMLFNNFDFIVSTAETADNPVITLYETIQRQYAELS